MSKAIEWLVRGAWYFVACLPVPVFLVGIAPNLFDSGILGWAIILFAVPVLIAATLRLIQAINQCYREINTNEK